MDQFCYKLCDSPKWINIVTLNFTNELHIAIPISTIAFERIFIIGTDTNYIFFDKKHCIKIFTDAS